MKIGMMNYPAANVFDEIEWAAKNGFDFLDLTLEPPMAYIDELDAAAIKAKLNKHKLGIVGHTAYYLPIGSPLKALREAAVNEIVRCMEFFKNAGAKKMNVHPDFNVPHFFSREEVLGFNIESLKKIVAAGNKIGITVMLENLDSRISQLKKIFSGVPGLKFHFDLGHANLMPGECDTKKMLTHFAGILSHVHLSDNKGGYSDLHIPLGAGTVDWRTAIGILKDICYDDTLTLEIFSQDRDYLLLTKEKVKKLQGKLRNFST